MNSKTRVVLQHQDSVARVYLAAPKANILDRIMVEELEAIFRGLHAHEGLRAIVVQGDGPHFSFGASVEEHLPDEIQGALARLGSLLRAVVAAPAPTIAAVRGQCLGGGLELALACDLIVAEEDALLGSPEIKLGVFPPAATALLPVRVGVAGAAAMTLTGRSWTGMQAMQQGLVCRVGPEGGLEGSIAGLLDECFLSRSPVGLRIAAHAVRRPIARALEEELPRLDRLYLDRLMLEADAIEGIRAFLERREPSWKKTEEVEA